MKADVNRSSSKMKTLGLRTFLVLGFLANLFASDPSTANQRIPRSFEAPEASEVPCPSEDAIYLNEAKAAYNQAQSRTKAVAHEVLLRGRVRLFDTDDNLIILKAILGSPEPELWSYKANGCRTVFCVVRRLVDSDEAAYRLLTIPKISSLIFTLSPRKAGEDYMKKVKASSVWTKEELRQFHKALEIVPPYLKVFKRPYIVYRAGIRDANYAARTFATQESVIYKDTFLHGDLPFDGSERTPFAQKVLIHELCHMYDMESERFIPQLDRDDVTYVQPPELSASMWYGMNIRPYANQKISAMSDGDTYEDFAEACAYYVANPKTLIARAPDKFRIISETVFKSLDFTQSEWNQPLFQYLDQFLLSDGSESACEADFTQFINASVEIDATGRVTELIPAGVDDGIHEVSPVTQTISYKEWPRNSQSVNRIIQKRLIDFIPIAKQDLNFCKNGGEAALLRRFQSACPKTIARLNSLVHYSHENDFKAAFFVCMKKRDYSRECLTAVQEDRFIHSMGDSPLARAIIKKTRSATFPTSFRANEVNAIPVEEWLPSCLARTKTVSLEGRVLKYTMKDDVHSAVSYPFLSPLASPHASKLALSCFEDIREALAKRGVSFGSDISDLEITSLLSEADAYRDVIQSLENSVILPLIYLARSDPDYVAHRPLYKLPKARRVVSLWIRRNARVAKVSKNQILDRLPQY